jgi:hypothetical protein
MLGHRPRKPKVDVPAELGPFGQQKQLGRSALLMCNVTPLSIFKERGT